MQTQEKSFLLHNSKRELKQQRRRQLQWNHWINEMNGAASNFTALIPSRSIREIMAIFFWSWILKGCIKFQEKKEKVVAFAFTSSTRREMRYFHVIIVQWRLRNVQKSVMHEQSCCFANLKLLLFCRSRCRRLRRRPRGRRYLSSLMASLTRRLMVLFSSDSTV